jgi:hypothetical protein
MTPLILSFASALAGVFSPGHGDVRVVHQRLDGWNIELRNDQFRKATSCVIARGPIRLENGVMVFRFPRYVTTTQAEFRVDGGPARSVGELAVEAAGRGVRLDTSDLRHPGGGRVALPLRAIAGAQAVDIRPNEARNHRAFDLRGLPSAIDAAKRQGCDAAPDAAAAS